MGNCHDNSSEWIRKWMDNNMVDSIVTIMIGNLLSKGSLSNGELLFMGMSSKNQWGRNVFFPPAPTYGKIRGNNWGWVASLIIEWYCHGKSGSAK